MPQIQSPRDPRPAIGMFMKRLTAFKDRLPKRDRIKVTRALQLGLVGLLLPLAWVVKPLAPLLKRNTKS